MLSIKSYKIHITEVLRDLDQKSSWTVVTPSPLKSDIFREVLIAEGLSSKISSITISKFISDQFAEREIERKSKSALLLELWTIWKLKVDEDLAMFRYAFDLFTELRSYSLSVDLIHEAKELLDEKVYDALLFFHQYFSNAEIIDEQKSYQLCGEIFEGTANNYIFWGFDHINSNQIDMIKNISQTVDVVIPLPENVILESSNLDWPNWLSTEDLNVQDSSELYEFEAVEIPKGRMSEVLEKLRNSQQTSIYLVDKNIDLLKTQALSNHSSLMKGSGDIFSIPLKKLIKELREKFDGTNEVLATEIENLLKERIDHSFSVETIRDFKVSTQFQSTLSNFIGYSKKNESLKIEDINLIKEVIELDLPRTSLISDTFSASDTILERDYLNKLNDNAKNFFFVEKDSESSLRDNSNYSPDLMSLFSAYGPLQSKKVENLLLENLLINFCQRNGILLYEEGSFDESYEWGKVLRRFNLNSSTIDIDNKGIFIASDLDVEHLVGKVSATKIQSYIDCPRKYYYDYISKFNLYTRSKTELGADLRGIIEHLLIEKYVEIYSNFNTDDLRKLARNIINEVVKDHQLNINESERKSTLVEVVSYVEDTIQLLLEIKNKIGAELIFEYDISQLDSAVSGRIDLIIKKDDELHVFDFKRSSFGIPSRKELEDFAKVQMWFYLQRIEKISSKIMSFGYLNLSDLSDSLVYQAEESVIGEYLFAVTKKVKPKFTVSEEIQKYKHFEMDQLANLGKDRKFQIYPRTDKACDFCVAKSICPKGVILA